MNDETQPQLAEHPKDVAEALVLKETAKRLELTWPGAYRSVCCEIKISHLAISAILQSNILSELEGMSMIEDQQGCGHAFKTLQKLAQSWVDDATRRNNSIADVLLRNMYRWLSNPSSKLYDPALKRVVQGLMHKLLLQLVAELQRLGATVVHADPNTLILCTGKRNMTAALGYVDYVLSTLRKRELLQWLDLSPNKWWHTILFSDKFNYVGVAARVPEEIKAVMAEGPGKLVDGDSGLLEAAASELALTPQEVRTPDIDYVCTAKDYLPEAVQETFLLYITEFVFNPWAESCKALLSGATQGGSQAAQDAANALEAQTAYLKTAIRDRFTEKLLTQVCIYFLLLFFIYTAVH